MNIPTVKSSDSVTFGYHHPLKTLWFKDRNFQRKVVKGLYGDVLAKHGGNLTTLEHLVPASQNGELVFSNIALATARRNNARGDAPLKDFLVPQKAIEYLLQFKDLKANGFSGNKYIAGLLETLKKLGVL